MVASCLPAPTTRPDHYPEPRIHPSLPRRRSPHPCPPAQAFNLPLPLSRLPLWKTALRPTCGTIVHRPRRRPIYLRIVRHHQMLTVARDPIFTDTGGVSPSLVASWIGEGRGNVAMRATTTVQCSSEAAQPRTRVPNVGPLKSCRLAGKLARRRNTSSKMS